MTQSLLSVSDLSVLSYSKGNKKELIRNITFQLNKGEVLGIVGESGSGKTLTALSIMQLLPSGLYIKNGEILFHAENSVLFNLTGDEATIKKIRGLKTGMIFQEPMTSLNPSLTCGYQIKEVIQKFTDYKGKDAKKKVLQLLEDVRLNEPELIYKLYPHQISGGQKQRIMIAIAISCNPSILIADEPTTALDITIQKRIINLLKELQQKYNLSIIFITHDLWLISKIADRILVMQHGEIVEQGNSQKVLRTPQHSYTKALLACRPSLEHAPDRLPTIKDFIDQSPVKKAFTQKIKKITSKLDKLPVLDVKDLSVTFTRNKNIFGKVINEIIAISNVSFQVYKGETLGIVGESGCGKTTLGRAIISLINYNKGNVLFKGINLKELRKREMIKIRNNIQIIFQDSYSSLNPIRRVGDILEEPLKVHCKQLSRRERKQNVIEILEKVNLSESFYFRFPHELSGGERQRICIARALIVKPEFIICDESVSALDVSIQAQILNILNDLKSEFNLTYIFISHDLAVVKYMSDRIMVMNEGKIEELDDSERIFKSPQSAYTRELIDSLSF